MTYKGHVEGGAVVLDEHAQLPDGAKVEIALCEPEQVTADDNSLPTLYERLKSVIGVLDGPADLAENHNHYAYGQPMR